MIWIIIITQMDNINFNSLQKIENIQKVNGGSTKFTAENAFIFNHTVNFGSNSPQIANTKVL